MEKRLNVTMGEAGARVDISGTPLDIVFYDGYRYSGYSQKHWYRAGTYW